MHRFAIFAAMLSLTGLTPAQESQSDKPHWTPDKQTALRIESALEERMHRAELPELGSYDRYYWGVTVDGNRIVRGRLEMHGGADSTTHEMLLLSDAHEDNPMRDAGCNLIRVAYDIGTSKLTEFQCDASWGLPGKLSPYVPPHSG